MSPIKAENSKLYPVNWKDIRKSILARAGNCCEICSVKNWMWLYRDGKWVKIVLTIAHLDHDPTHNDSDNLKALCQRCHNRHDAKHRQENARKTRRAKKAMGDLFGGD